MITPQTADRMAELREIAQERRDERTAKEKAEFQAFLDRQGAEFAEERERKARPLVKCDDPLCRMFFYGTVTSHVHHYGTMSDGPHGRDESQMSPAHQPDQTGEGRRPRRRPGIAAGTETDLPGSRPDQRVTTVHGEPVCAPVTETDESHDGEGTPHPLDLHQPGRSVEEGSTIDDLQDVIERQSRRRSRGRTRGTRGESRPAPVPSDREDGSAPATPRPVVRQVEF